MAKDTFYFSHDYNARNDAKIKKLLSRHGYFGYGIFWAIIEDLYNNANALPTDYDSIAFDLRADKIMVESIVKDFELFTFDAENFGSLSVKRRLEERSQKSVRARESALNRWSKNANALRSHNERIENLCEGNAIKERKGKERREISIPKTTEFKIQFAEQLGWEKEKLKFYFEVLTDWSEQGHKYKNWIAAARQFERSDKLKNKGWYEKKPEVKDTRDTPLGTRDRLFSK